MDPYNNTFHDDYEDFWYIPKQFILLGPPGSGKSTLAEAISKAYSTDKFSAGSLLREEIVCDTILGNQIKETVESGELVSTEVMTELMARHIRKSESYVLDNFPRSVEQAELVRNFFKYNDLIVIRLDISWEEADQRIEQRSRKDDIDPAIVNRRREIYNIELTEIIQTLLSGHGGHYFSIEVDNKSTISIMNEIKLLMGETV